jgi:hypothetical protein
MFIIATVLAFSLAFGCGGGSGSSGANPPPLLVQVAAPVFSVATGTYTQAQTVTVTCATSGATLYYTVDGGTPTSASTKYNSAIVVSSTTTLKAIAIAIGYADSAIASATYTIQVPGPSYTWKNVQIIAGGYVDGISFHPTQRDLVYARTDMGGAYRWDKTASRWIPLTDWVGRANWNYLGIEAIGLDPSDSQRLYLAAGTYSYHGWSGCCSAFLVSTDQGSTFTTVTNSFPMGGNENGRFSGDRLAVDPNLGGKLYYGTDMNGLWSSADHGAHWSSVSSFPITGSTTGAGIVFVQFVKSSGTSGSATPVVYVGVSEKDGTNGLHTLYRSIDGGATWDAVPNVPAAMASLYVNHGYFSPDGSLYMTFGNNIGPNGMTTGAVWKYTPTSNPGGAGVWADITPPNPSYSTNGVWGYGGLAVDQQNPGTIMVMTMDLWWLHDDMFRSTDGGATWIELGATSVRDGSLSPFVNWGGSSPGVGNWAQIAIDPFNADHVIYSTGATVWDSTNVRASQPGTAIPGTTLLKGGVTNWTVGALGIEQTAVVALISPPSGAPLISALGDVGGFVHNDLTVSPAGGMLSPRFDTTNGLDFAQNNASVIVRTGSISPWGAYSTNSGASWTQFATTPTGVSGGGSVAVSADGNTYVWAPTGAATSYTSNKGTTWTPSTGAPAGKPVYSDRVNSNKFYIFDASAGTLYISTDAGKTFAKVNQSLPTNGNLAVAFAAEGDLWLASNNGLYHSTNSGTSFSPVSGVQQGYAVGFGKAATGQTYPAIYLAGQINNTQAIFRSTDGGASWIRINDDQHQYGSISVMTGDPRTFGRVYLGANGRGIIYGDSSN